MGKCIIILGVLGLFLVTGHSALVTKDGDNLPGFLRNQNLSPNSLDILKKHASRVSHATKARNGDPLFVPLGNSLANQTYKSCQIQVKTDMHRLASSWEIFDYFQRKVDVLDVDDDSSTWIMEPVGSEGMFKLRNKQTNEYITSFIPWFDEGIFDQSVPVTSNEHLECEYYYLWHTTLLSDGYMFLQHNATNSYLGSIWLEESGHFTGLAHESDELYRLDEYRWRITCTD